MSTAAGTPDRLSAVLFDMDGNLVETEESWGEALAALARRQGGAGSPAPRRAAVGTSMPVALGILYADLGLPADEERLAADSAWVLDLMVELLAGDLDREAGARGASARGAG